MAGEYSPPSLKSFRHPKRKWLPASFRWSKRPAMDLEKYLEQPGSMNLTELSAAIGVTKARLSQIRSARKWPPHLALKAEVATGGMISASEVCPIVAAARAA